MNRLSVSVRRWGLLGLLVILAACGGGSSGEAPDASMVAGKWCSLPGSHGWCLQTPAAPTDIDADNYLARVDGLWFFDRQAGMARTATGCRRSGDGGATWTPAQDCGLGTDSLRQLWFSADGAVGWASTFWGALYTSTDRGQTWRANLVQDDIPMMGALGFHFVTPQRGWVLRRMPYADALRMLLKTEDGGRTWQSVLEMDLAMESWFGGIAFSTDGQYGVALGGYQGSYVTSDGGLTWVRYQREVEAEIVRVRFVAQQTFLAISREGGILRSEDGGRSWRVVRQLAADARPPFFYELEVLPSGRAYASGGGGLLVSHDGGLTWREQATGIGRSPDSMHFADEMTGWIGFAGNAIMATIYGGD